jgi:2-polyprenyl-3-methyl-5-hydroxy-6-metoxy-1,4-benzoquinol methylase
MKSNNFLEQKETVDDYFSRLSISTDEVHYAYDYYGEDTLQLLGDVRGKHTLEIGCGAGQNTIALAKQGAFATGIDLSHHMLEKAKQYARENSLNARFIQQAAESFSIDEAYDIIISAHVLDYILDTKKVFEQVYKHSNSDATFIFSHCHPCQTPEFAQSIEGSFFTEGKWPGKEEITRNYFHPQEKILHELIDTGFYVQRIINAADYDVEEGHSRPYSLPHMRPYTQDAAQEPHTIIYKTILKENDRS